MLDTKVKELLAEQINKELYSAYLYLGIANYYSDQGLMGFENWFKVQAQEELDHAERIRRYLLDNNAKITLTAVDAPAGTYGSVKDPLTAALKHEQYITSSINEIYKTADDCNDYRSLEFLGWFINEQAEEEKNADDNLKAYDLIAEDPGGLFLLDRELKDRG